MVLQKGFNNLRGEAMTMFAVVPRPPVYLGKIREIQEQNSIGFEFGQPVLQSVCPVVYVLQTVARKDVVNLVVGQTICCVSIRKNFIDTDSSRKLPLLLGKSDVIPDSFAKVFRKGNRKLRSISLGLKGRVEVFFEGDQIHLKERRS